MSDNKFIQRLKGEQTPKSVVEIQNDKLVAPFTNVPNSTDVVGGIIDVKDSSVVVAKGAQNWKINGSSLVVASSLSGDGADYTGEFNVSGSGLWINATYSLPATIFSAGTKWVLRLCGKNLLTTSGGTIDFTLVVKIGNTHITSKAFTVAEGANVFCRQLVIDFSESEQAIIKAQSGDSLTVQLLCSDTNASATIYNGMTVFTALQRRVDGDAVVSDKYTFDELGQNLETHISDKNNPHEVTKTQVGLGNCDNTSDLDKPISTATQTALNGKVNIDGSSIMTGPLKMRATSSFQGAIAPFWDGVGFYKLNSDNSVTLIASIETPDGFVPWTTNTYNIGSSLKKWKNLYLSGKLFVSTINNGGDLTFPANTTGTLATKGDVDLAANSGRMITDQGVWYAKMYDTTIVPSAEDGTNYADFSQTDGRNPIIIICKRVNGAWVRDKTITPPAEYDGYVPITSKIWDIVEQAGQQGGRILWNHQSKKFTPYPQIISFDGQNITNSTFSGGTITNSTFSGTATLSGTSTVVMPQDPTGDQIVNKDYVDEAIAAIPTPTVDIKQSIDADIVGTLTINGAIVSGFSGSNYLSIPSSFHLSGADISSFEIGCSFTTQDPIGTSYYHMLRGRVNLMIDPTYHQLRVEITDGTNTQTFFGTTNLAGNTKYYEKLEYDGTNYKLWLSTDGSTYNLENTVAATVFATDYSDYKICRDNPGAVASIDMSDWFVKTNGLIIWSGMDSPGLHQRVVKGHEVIAFQAPTAANNYKWYRKYADGWVEQGQHYSSAVADQSGATLPVTMVDSNYSVQLSVRQSGDYFLGAYGATTTGFTFRVHTREAVASSCLLDWQVSGMYAQ